MKEFNDKLESHSHLGEPLDSRQLKAFAILAKTGSYTETARQLYVTHSAISHAMRVLESDAGCRLLSRLGKKVILTDAGEALLNHAEEVLGEMRRARRTLNGLNKWGYRRMRFAAEAALGQHFLTSALVRFHQEFPRVLISVEYLNNMEAQNVLETNRAELVLTEKPMPDDRFEFIPLFTDCFHIVVGPRHNWASKGSVPREELPKQPFILYRTLSKTRRMLEEHLAKDGVVLNLVAEIDSVNDVKEFIKQTGAMSILPSWTITRELEEKSLVALALGRKSLEQTWGFTHWRGRPLNHAESTFIRLCREGISAVGGKGRLSEKS